MKTEIIVAVIGAVRAIIAAVIGLFKKNDKRGRKKKPSTTNTIIQVSMKDGDNNANLGVNSINNCFNTKEQERH